MLPQLNLDKAVNDLVAKHRIAINDLTERQVADAIKQAILAGDFKRYMRCDDYGQIVVYLPYDGVESLRAENARLKTELQELRDQIAGALA